MFRHIICHVHRKINAKRSHYGSFFARLAKVKIALRERSKSHLFLYRTVNQPFTSKSAISNQLINYKTTAIGLSLYYHLAILDIDTLLSLIAMNEQIMKKPFSGIHGLVPNPPKMAMVVKVSNPKLVKRSK